MGCVVKCFLTQSFDSLCAVPVHFLQLLPLLVRVKLCDCHSPCDCVHLADIPGLMDC